MTRTASCKPGLCFDIEQVAHWIITLKQMPIQKLLKTDIQTCFKKNKHTSSHKYSIKVSICLACTQWSILTSAEKKWVIKQKIEKWNAVEAHKSS
jgi:hypothetical protein